MKQSRKGGSESTGSPITDSRGSSLARFGRNKGRANVHKGTNGDNPSDAQKLLRRSGCTLS